jgi:hypothetical protein
MINYHICLAFLLSAFAFQAITALPVAHAIDGSVAGVPLTTVTGALPVGGTVPVTGTVPVVGTTASNPTPPGGSVNSNPAAPAVITSGSSSAACGTVGIICGVNALNGPILDGSLNGLQALDGVQAVVPVGLGIIGTGAATAAQPDNL